MQVSPIFAQPRTHAAIFVLAFVALAFAAAATRAPWCDEAYFAEPAYQLAIAGKLATVVVPPSPIDDPKTYGTDRYTYYAMPLDLILQAGWYRLAGFGLLRLRLLSIFWGVTALGAWWMILTGIAADARLRLVALAAIALDYTFIHTGSDGRMDMMSAALGFLGFGLFLRFQERAYSRAVFYGCCCTAASAFTHPIGGLLATAALGVAMLWYGRGRFRWWHVPLAALPYLLLLGAWGLYIAEAPNVFQAQFSSISNGRLSAWKEPLSAMAREFGTRWAGPFGLDSGGGVKTVKALSLAFYAGALLWATARWKRIANSGFCLIVLVTWLDLGLLCFAEGTKSAAYLIHVIPWLAVLAALLFTRYWRPAGAVAFAALLLVQTVGNVYQTSRLQYQREYLPAVAFLKSQSSHVTGVAELGFGLGFQPGLTDDRRLGFYLRKPPHLFVIDATYLASYRDYRATRPEVFAWVTGLTQHAKIIFSNSLYRVYEE